MASRSALPLTSVRSVFQLDGPAKYFASYSGPTVWHHLPAGGLARARGVCVFPLESQRVDIGFWLTNLAVKTALTPKLKEPP
ncbi:uncharacterized protein METZ01_LOCUS356084 [marine metagenome]|uniref:Uncharacterized protein n=1 Tax=marine metagenome TaxID=408172 RepID=A0A382S0D8_9ZZZZ